TVLRPNRLLHLVAHRTPRGRLPNTGVLALQGGDRSQRFLEAVWKQERFVHDRWWENAAVNHVLGYRMVPGGSVHRIVPSRWQRGVGTIDRAWNSIPEDAAPDPFILHFPGVSLDVRRRGLEQAVAFV